MERQIPEPLPRLIGITAVILAMTLAWPLSANAQCTEPVGDLDGSSAVDVTDVQCALLVALAALSPAPAPSLLDCVDGDATLADVHCDDQTNIVDVLVTVSKALGAPLPFPTDSNGNGCPTLCDAPATEIGMPEILWQLLDYQPESPGFDTVYGPGQISGVTVIVLLDGG